MRLLFVTPHRPDVDAARRALDGATPRIDVDACPDGEEAARELKGGGAQAVLVDTTASARALRDVTALRAAHPDLLVVALVDPAGGEAAANALLAGADDTLPKRGDTFPALAAVLRRLAERRRHGASTGVADMRVLVAAREDHPALRAITVGRAARASDAWWADPAPATAAAKPDAVVIDDSRGTVATATALRALRERMDAVPVVVVSADAAAAAAYERLGATAVLHPDQISTLQTTLSGAIARARLAAELTAARAKEHRLRDIVESVPASVVLANADGTVLAMNAAALGVVGAASAGEVVGQSLFRLCDESDADDLRQFVQAVCAGHSGFTRFHGRTLDGSTRPLELRAVPMAREHDATVLLGVLRVAADTVPAETAGAGDEMPDLESLDLLIDDSPAGAEVSGVDVEALQQALATERAAREQAQQELERAGAQQQVQEAAWTAIRSELQRRLVLQSHLADGATDGGDEPPRDERDVHLAKLADEIDRLQSALAERELEITGLTAAQRSSAEALNAANEEVSRLRETAERTAREHVALADVRQQVARLQAAAATVEQQQRALDDANDQMERLRTALEESLGTQTDLERALRQRGQDLAGAIADRDLALDRQQELEGENAALRVAQDEWARAAEEAAALREQLSVLRGQLEEAQARVRELQLVREDSASAHAALSEVEARYADLEARANVADSLRGEMFMALDAAQSRLRELEQAQRDAAGVSESLRAAEARLAEAEARAVAAESSRDALAAELEAAREDAARQRQHLEERVQQADALAEDKANLQRALADAGEEVAGLRRRSAEADELAAALDAARSDVRAAREERDALRGQIAALTSEVSALRERAEEAQRLVAELASARAKVEEAAHSVAELQAARNEVQQALVAERDVRAALERSTAAAESSIEASQRALQAREEELAAARAAVTALTEQRERLTQSWEAASAARSHEAGVAEELRQKAGALEAQVAAQQAALEDLSRAQASLQSALEDALAERDAAARALDAARESHKSLQADHQSLRDQIVTMGAHIADQRRLLAEIDAERGVLHERIARAEAASQMQAARHRSDVEARDRTVQELRGRLEEAETLVRSGRAALERALAAGEAAANRLMQSTVVGLATTAGSGAILRCNDTLAAFCGYGSANELLSRAVDGGLPFVNDWPAFTQLVVKAEAPVVVETCLQRPDGGVTWLHATAVAVPRAEGDPLLEWTVVDASERQLRLHQQRQSRRLESVRELAVSAGADLVELFTPQAYPMSGPDAASPAALAARDRRAREIAQQLASYAQKQARPAQFVDLNEQVSHLRLTFARLAGEDIAAEIQLAPRPLLVTADPAEVDHWLTSLFVLSRDALPGVGQLSITTTMQDLAQAGMAPVRKVIPVATLSLRSSGYGVRPIAPPTAVQESVTQRGGILRVTHDAASSANVVELHLPVVSVLTTDDASRPSQQSEPLA